jgi:hypothetical protein
MPFDLAECSVEVSTGSPNVGVAAKAEGSACCPGVLSIADEVASMKRSGQCVRSGLIRLSVDNHFSISRDGGEL